MVISLRIEYRSSNLDSSITNQTGGNMEAVREQHLLAIEESLRQLMFMTGIETGSEAQLLALDIVNKVREVREELAK